MLWLFIIIRRCVRVTLNRSNISRFFLSFCAFSLLFLIFIRSSSTANAVRDICRRRRRKHSFNHSIVQEFSNRFLALKSFWTHSFSPADFFRSVFSVLEPDLVRTSEQSIILKAECIQFTCLKSFYDLDYIFTWPYAICKHRFEFECVVQFSMHTRPICCEMLSIRYLQFSSAQKWQQPCNNPMLFTHFKANNRVLKALGNSVRNICTICERNDCECAFDMRVEMVNHLSAELTFIKRSVLIRGMSACRSLSTCIAKRM